MNPLFTVRDDPAVNHFIKGHLDIITRELQDLIGKDLVAIILTGGFGRGEGSVSIRPDGHMHVVNDYDIDIVYRESYGSFPSKFIAQLRYSRSLTSIADRLSDQLDIKQIDLCLRGEGSYASNQPPLLAEYDTKKGNILLHGSRNPVDLMPDYDAHDIPAFEGTWLLRNRGIGLLLASFYLHDGVLQNGKEEYFLIEINKAILAMGDALYIANGTYHHSYAVRSKLIETVIPHDMQYADEICSYYKSAAKQKLLPQGNPFSDMEPAELWTHINNLYCSFFLYYESRRLGKHFENIITYADAQLSPAPTLTLKQRSKIVFERLRGTLDEGAAHIAHIKPDKASTIIMTFLLLTARTTGDLDAACLQRACKMAKLDVTDDVLQKDWRSLAKAFLLLIHPKGELGRVLRNT